MALKNRSIRTLTANKIQTVLVCFVLMELDGIDIGSSTIQCIDIQTKETMNEKALSTGASHDRRDQP